MALILDKTEQKIVDIIDAHRNEIIAFAKDIYTHAELGYKEYRTAEKFASFMKNLGLETKEGLAVTGVKAYLNEEEKIAMCKAVTNAKADYIKTSTGFGTAGATMEDILLFKKHIGPDVKMKAAGGIKSVADLEAFIEAGCDRIGTSSALKMLEGASNGGEY